MPTLIRGTAAAGPAARRSVGPSTSAVRTRVVLLLDLDCFYAQCEQVRLGLDPAMPAAVLQWNSSLAVTYPARAMGVERGDSFEAIQEKTGGKCVALHLPVISVSTLSGDAACPEEAKTTDRSTPTAVSDEDSIEISYADKYQMTPEVRAKCFAEEKNRMRHPQEGKACLERYRVASAMIFRTMTEALTEHLGKGRFVLERASIDEIFLDVSRHCCDDSCPVWKPSCAQRGDGTSNSDIAELSKTETVVCADGSVDLDLDEDDEEIRALRRGCAVARGVRKAVYDRLGFTLSAGISINKMVAKLGASYGKPNGQAVVFPQAIPELLNNTEIRKVRHFGGKAGKKILALLPESETKMGSIARLLPLNRLVDALGPDAAQQAFDVARGVDHEEVTETKGALTKSITAFKSFHRANLVSIHKWITLLATDVCHRVDLDFKRNSRFPKNCNIQYVYFDGDNRVTRSLRIPFPSKYDISRKTEELISKVTETLQKKGKFPINRLGLSAVDFQIIATDGGIQSFFGVKDQPCSSAAREKVHDEDQVGQNKHEEKTNEQKSVGSGPIARNLHGLCHGDEGGEPARLETSERKSESSTTGDPEQIGDAEEGYQTKPMFTNVESSAAPDKQYDDDMDMARRMQETFDNEGQGPASGTASSDRTSLKTVEKQVYSRQGKQGSDLAYARKLQTLYDKEESALSTFDKHAAGTGSKRPVPRGHSRSGSPKKKNRIESFFKKVDR